MKSFLPSTNKPANKISPTSSVQTFKTTCIVSAITTLMLGSGNVVADTASPLLNTQQLASVATTRSINQPIMSSQNRAGHRSGNGESYDLGNNYSFANQAIANISINGGIVKFEGNSIAVNTSVSQGRLTLYDTSTNNVMTVTGGQVLGYGNSQINNATISGGTVAIQANVGIYDTNISGNGTLSASSDSRVYTTKLNGGTFVLKGNSSSLYNTVLNGSMQALENASVDKLTISGGTVLIGDTAKVLNTTLTGGVMKLNGTASATTTNISNATVDIEENAHTDTSLISPNGAINMRGNSTAANTTINGGQFNLNNNANATNTTVIGGATFTVANDATSIAANVSNGNMTVSDTATASGTNISGTGLLSITGQGKADLTRLTGGTMALTANATITNTTISGTGQLNISGRGKASLTQLTSGTMALSANANATNTTVTGGAMNLTNGSKANITTISSGSVSLTDTAEAKTTTVSGTGQLKLAGQSNANLTQLNGGTMALTGNATASNTTITLGAMTLANTSKAATTLMNGGSLSLTDTAEAVTTNVSGGTFNIGGRALASNSNINTNGTLNLSGNGRTLTTTVAGIMSVDGSASASDTIVASGGRFNIAAGTTINGTRINSGGTMRFATGATAQNTDVLAGGNLIFAGNATLSGTTTINGTAKFTAPATGANYSVLTVNGDLDGNGTFHMNAHSAVNKGDMIKIIGKANGSNTIVVADSGTEALAPGQQARLVESQGGPGLFALQGRTVDVGAFRYELAKQGNNWALVRSGAPLPITPVGPGSNGTISPGTGSNGTIPFGGITPAGSTGTSYLQKNLSKAANAAVASHAATSVALVAQMNALVKRLGELRMGKDDGGMWTRAYVKEQRLDTSSSRSFEQQVSGTEFGLDKAYQLGENKVYVGGLLGLGRVKQDFNEGVKGKVNSFSAGAYTSLIAPDGSYADAVFKYSRFDNEVDFVDNMGLGVKAEHKNTAYMLNLEVGKRIDLSANWFVEPQLELMATQINGADYAASNGMQVKQASVRSLQSRIGTLVGHNFKMDDGRLLQTYAKASWINEHKGKSNISINGTSLDSVLPGSRAEVGVGMIVQAADKHKFHVDLEYTKGKEIKQPVALNVGYRYLW